MRLRNKETKKQRTSNIKEAGSLESVFSLLLNFSKKKAEFSVRGIVIEPAERAVGAAMKTTHEIPMRIEPM